MVMTMPKKLTSGVGMLSYIFLTPCSSVTPTFRLSTRRLNSPPQGSGTSRATMRSASLVGRPDLTLRTMTSIALANSLVKAFSRRRLRKPSTQRGTPNRLANSDRPLMIHPWPERKRRA